MTKGLYHYLREAWKKPDGQGTLIMKTFMWSFVILLSLFMLIVVLAGISSLNDFFVAIIIGTILSSFFAFFIALMVGAGRRGMQIGEIIEAKHKKIKKPETSDNKL